MKERQGLEKLEKEIDELIGKFIGMFNLQILQESEQFRKLVERLVTLKGNYEQRVSPERAVIISLIMIYLSISAYSGKFKEVAEMVHGQFPLPNPPETIELQGKIFFPLLALLFFIDGVHRNRSSDSPPLFSDWPLLARAYIQVFILNNLTEGEETGPAKKEN